MRLLYWGLVALGLGQYAFLYYRPGYVAADTAYLAMWILVGIGALGLGLQSHCASCGTCGPPCNCDHCGKCRHGPCCGECDCLPPSHEGHNH